MIEVINKIFAGECQINPDQTLLVAVSGGPDSLCLMDILARLGYKIIVAHLDHGLRAESETEARSVESIALALGIPFVGQRLDVGAYTTESKLSIEEAGRNLRYRFLFTQAERHNAGAVVTGHTADDQVETVLMHLLRGAGLSGLSGMAYYSLPNAWNDRIPLIRPLLGVWRDEIDAYLKARDLHPLQDLTNLDTHFFRNRLRHELIPILESYNPGIKIRLWRTAQLLSDDYAVLKEITEAAWEASIYHARRDYLSFDLPELLSHPPAIQRHLIRKAISELRPRMRDIDYTSIERARQFMTSPSKSGQIDLIARTRLSVRSGRVYIADWAAELPEEEADFWPGVILDETVTLQVPGQLNLSGGWMLSAEPFSIEAETLRCALDNLDPYQAWVDAERITEPIQVRRRAPGDRFQPLGMDGHTVKLSDFMINVRLPARARIDWPVVVSGGRIIWLPGLRLAHPFRLSPETRLAIHLNLLKT